MACARHGQTFHMLLLLITQVAAAGGEVIITNDGAIILNKMTVAHPAAKMLVELAKSQVDCSAATEYMPAHKHLPSIHEHIGLLPTLFVEAPTGSLQTSYDEQGPYVQAKQCKACHAGCRCRRWHHFCGSHLWSVVEKGAGAA